MKNLPTERDTHSLSSAHMANKQKDKCDAPLHAAPEPINRYGTPGAPPERGLRLATGV